MRDRPPSNLTRSSRLSSSCSVGHPIARILDLIRVSDRVRFRVIGLVVKRSLLLGYRSFCSRFVLITKRLELRAVPTEGAPLLANLAADPRLRRAVACVRLWAG